MRGRTSTCSSGASASTEVPAGKSFSWPMSGAHGASSSRVGMAGIWVARRSCIRVPYHRHAP